MTKTIEDQIIKEAEGWYEIYKAGHLSDEDRTRFSDWFKKDTNHPHAFEQVFIARESGVDFSKNDFTVPHNGLNAGMVRSVETPAKINIPFLKGRLWRPAFQFGGVVAALLLLTIYLYPLLSSPETTTYHTKLAQIETIDLEEGSRIILGAGSVIRVSEFTDDVRTVYLDKGEALFSVTKYPSRPFIVVSDETEVRVLGTKFNMNKSSGDLTVSLLEGRVKVVQEMAGKVIPFLTTEKTVELEPAQSLSVHEGILQQVRPRDVETMANWVRGQLTYNDASLKQFVDDLNRYSPRPIRLAGSQLKDYKVTVTLNVTQVDAAIMGLPYLLPVKVARDSTGTYVIRPR